MEYIEQYNKNILKRNIYKEFMYDGNIDYIKGFQNKKILTLDRIYEVMIGKLLSESINNMEYVGETIERYAKDLLKEYISDISLRNFYAYIMREMIRNVFEHSKAKKSYLFIYKSDDNEELGFKVIDNGIGLKKSLNENPNYDIKNHMSAVTLAIKPGISRAYKKDLNRDDIWQNSGFGLYMISSICERYGNFSLSSGNYGINKKNSIIDYIPYTKTRIKGTEVTVSIKLDLIEDIPMLLKDISLKGNQMAESNKFSKIKTASQASTLIEE
ncbi:hypothetical protein QTH09_00480 [Clostridium perfringens]|nr:hypothetical protein [Clostridium perfringens]